MNVTSEFTDQAADPTSNSSLVTLPSPDVEIEMLGVVGRRMFGVDIVSVLAAVLEDVNLGFTCKRLTTIFVAAVFVSKAEVHMHSLRFVILHDASDNM